MELNHFIVERLAFIKFLYQHGVELSNKPSPYNFASILMFHDSVDLFLQLATEKLNIQIKKEKTYFWDYLKLINQQLSNNNKELYHMKSMIRLNGARNSLKHEGRGSIKSDIESFRDTTKDFFIDNTPLIFGIKFSDISMIDLVQNDEVRNVLKDVENFSKNGQYKDALEHIAVAFDILIIDYEKDKKYFGISIFDFGDVYDIDFKYEESEKLEETLENMQFALKLLCFKIDYRKYKKYQILTPKLYRKYRGAEKKFNNIVYDKFIPSWFNEEEREFTNEQIEFCFNFIIESALKLQEFDFEVKDFLEL